ncbi:uncharacterized protein mettl21ca [Synchiropus picturatus]
MFTLDLITTNMEEETASLSSGEEGLEEEEEQERGDSEGAEVQKQERPVWAPCFYYKAGKEVFTYVDQDIIIEEGLDNYGGMVWPGALALCQYLDTHRDQVDLVGKAVLEIGAGTGLLSVVASLLGAWVTATDLPEILNNLRFNLSRNTRGRCRHTPQVAALEWSYDLEQTYPKSVYRYDYVFAAEVVYHHDFCNELLATMEHFCRPGTTLIWANKIRIDSDLAFLEKFQKSFDTCLLAEHGEIKIFKATCKEEEWEKLAEEQVEEEVEEEPEQEKEENTEEGQEEQVVEKEEEQVVEKEEEQDDEEEETNGEEEGDKETEKISDSGCQGNFLSTALRLDRTPLWVPSINSHFGRDVYHYAGHDIVIHETIDSYGAVMWPGALALCSYLDNNRDTVDLRDKEVLELGAGTGLVSIVASLLGASVTATDLPDILGNLRANIMRNTRGCCRYTPKVEVLCWSLDLSKSHPSSIYQYDYVLAADVVYHHDYPDELLATMKHFCRPGTSLIWANKIRMVSDLTFLEKFKETFDTCLLVEDGDMKIFKAAYKK